MANCGKQCDYRCGINLSNIGGLDVRFRLNLFVLLILTLLVFDSKADEIRVGLQAGMNLTGFTATNLSLHEPAAGAGFTGGAHIEHFIGQTFSIQYLVSYNYLRPRLIDDKGVAPTTMEDRRISESDKRLYNDQTYELTTADLEILPGFNVSLHPVPVRLGVYLGTNIRYRYRISQESENFGTPRETSTRGGFNKWDLLLSGGLRVKTNLNSKVSMFLNNTIHFGIRRLDDSSQNTLIFPESRMVSYQGILGVSLRIWENAAEQDDRSKRREGLPF